MGVTSIRETLKIITILFLQTCFLLLFIFPSKIKAQEKTVTFYNDPAGIPPDLPVTIKHLTARVSFRPAESLVMGDAEFTIIPNRETIDSIVFQAPGFTVSSVSLNNQKIGFHLSGNNLVVETHNLFTPGKTVAKGFVKSALLSRLRIIYQSKPENGLIYFIGWKPEESGQRRQIWAHRPNGWLPYMDGRITVDMYVTFDKAFKVFSNGERLEVVTNKDSTLTWHYAMKKDHPFFSTALVIGDYNFVQGHTARGVPLEFWYYSDMPDRVATTYRYTERMFDFLEAELGFNYPYPLYREAPVIDYMYGAMETTTSTVFGDYMQITPRSWWQRNYVNVNAHELTHQWFGNCITHLVNKDVWLTESFATYYAKMFELSIYGEEYFQNIRNDEMKLTFDAAKKNDYPVGGSQGGVQRIYQKGSLVLEMLHDVMGDAGFRKAINIYLNRFAFNYAETNDFIRCVYEATGKPYNWFFNQWILKGGEPEYLVTDSLSAGENGGSVVWFKVRQIQKTDELKGLFKMPVVFEVYQTDGTRSDTTVWVENQYTEVKIPIAKGKKTDFLLFDPNRKVLKKCQFVQSVERLLSQAQRASNMIDRYDAWVALRSVAVEDKVTEIITQFGREDFWLIRAEILQQLCQTRTPEVVELFREALNDKDANVRKAALLNLNPVPDMLRSSVEKALYDSSFLNVEYALEALCTSFPASAAQYLDQTRDMEGWRGKNIRMMWLAIAISGGQHEYLEELINYGSPKFEFETRINAFNLLGKLKYYDSGTIEFAELASKHWNNKLSSAAREYLKNNPVAPK